MMLVIYLKIASPILPMLHDAKEHLTAINEISTIANSVNNSSC